MPRYASVNLLKNGPQYLKDNCDKVILTNAYYSTYANVINAANKVAECALVTGDFAIAGADGAAQVLTATLTGKSMGNALLAVADGTNMHLAFVKMGTTELIYVTEESSDQPITLNNPIQLNSNPTYTSNQPTA